LINSGTEQEQEDETLGTICLQSC